MKQAGFEASDTHEMRSRAWTLRPHCRPLVLVLLTVLTLLMIPFRPWLPRLLFESLKSMPRPESALQGQSKAQLEVHIMSKCPDARDCLRELVVPAMEQVHDIVDFKLSFIGT
jgi:hypothetical protein